MKNRIIALILIVFISITVVSCSDDNGESEINDVDKISIMRNGETEASIVSSEKIPEYILINGESYGTDETELTLGLFGGQITNADIEPLKYMVNLHSLYINGWNTNINDISPLAELTNLSVLYFTGCQINDINPLAGLTNLTELDLQRNPISDISVLAKLTNLTKLFLIGNKIGDISPLAELTSLTKLNLSENPIKDINPLAGLTNLTALFLMDNQISDINPLKPLTNLTELRLDGNPISDTAVLASLTNLAWVRLDNTLINSGQIKALMEVLPNTSVNGFLRLGDNFANIQDTTKRGIQRGQKTADETDDRVLGKWEAIDFVKNIGDFTPESQNNIRSLDENYDLLNYIFFANGTVLKEHKTWEEFRRWTKGHIVDGNNFAGYNNGIRAYEIKTIDGDEYLFAEWDYLSVSWKNGNYEDTQKPWYYVFKRTMGYTEILSRYDGINKDYDWYIAQSNTGEHSASNCGPTVAVMAVKWHDKNFEKTPVDARNEILSDGAWWNISNIIDFLTSENTPAKICPGLSVEDVLNHLDIGNIIIFGIDTSYIKTNSYYYGTGGHFLIVKGYKAINNEIYFKVYDPVSGMHTYDDGSPAGKDRLYLASEVIEGNIRHSGGVVIINAP